MILILFMFLPGLSSPLILAEFEEGGGQESRDWQQIEEDLFSHIVWASKI